MTTTTRYHSPTLDTFLNSSFEEIREQVKIGAESTATKFLPQAIGDHMRSYWEEFHHTFQLLIDKINAELQFRSTCDTVVKHEQTAKKQKQVLDNKISEARQKQVPLDTQIKNTPLPISPDRHKKARIATAILCLTEGLFSTTCFESLGFNFLVSLLLGIGLGLVLAVFAEMFPKIIGLGTTKLKRYCIIAFLAIFTTILFKFMADMRVDALNTTGTGQYSPWPFVCLSELLLIVAVAVSYFYMPTQAEKDALLAYQKLLSDRKIIEDEITAHEASIATIEREVQEVRTTSSSILVYGSMLEEMVINNAKSCYALYKKHNLMHRTDGCKPDCFDEQYPFAFNTNFHTVKLLNHESIQ